VRILIVLSSTNPNPIRNAAKVRTELNKHRDLHHEILFGVWIVETSTSIDTWTQRFVKLLSKKCGLFIARIQGKEYNGLLEESSWKWICKGDRKEILEDQSDSSSPATEE
jgi:hypothetical protein